MFGAEKSSAEPAIFGDFDMHKRQRLAVKGKTLGRKLLRRD
jgi:hypothetical protein